MFDEQSFPCPRDEPVRPQRDVVAGVPRDFSNAAINAKGFRESEEQSTSPGGKAGDDPRGNPRINRSLVVLCHNPVLTGPSTRMPSAPSAVALACKSTDRCAKPVRVFDSLQKCHAFALD